MKVSHLINVKEVIGLECYYFATPNELMDLGIKYPVVTNITKGSPPGICASFKITLPPVVLPKGLSLSLIQRPIGRKSRTR